MSERRDGGDERSGVHLNGSRAPPPGFLRGRTRSARPPRRRPGRLKWAGLALERVAVLTRHRHVGEHHVHPIPLQDLERFRDSRSAPSRHGSPGRRPPLIGSRRCRQRRVGASERRGAGRGCQDPGERMPAWSARERDNRQPHTERGATAFARAVPFHTVRSTEPQRCQPCSGGACSDT